MKRLLICLVVVPASQANARDANVAVYTRAPTSSFQLIIPGQEEPAEAQGSLIPPNGVASELAAEFAPTESPVPQPLREAINVPAWMRTERAGRAPFQVQEFARQPAGNCAQSQYLPYVGLPASGEARRRIYYRDMAAAACEVGIPVELYDSLIVQESRYNPSALSPMGAIGMAQLMPGTARDLRVANPWDVVENLRGGARYLRQQLDEFQAWHLALGAYNAGPGSIRRHGGIPPYRETTSYVRSIMSAMRLNLRAGQKYQSSSGERAVRIAYPDL